MLVALLNGWEDRSEGGHSRSVAALPPRGTP